ncbi:MAG: amidohydrolase [Deltaproteobacteria bacterium]|nr:amidohydrolase [Deltaproteobacteria bacterium]
MDLILKNARIVTMDEICPGAEALAVKFGRIYRVGKATEIEPLGDLTTRVIDLKGQTVLPGFIDTHNHFSLYAWLINQVDCRPAAGCVKGDDIIEALRDKAARTPPGKWVLGWGYASYLLDDQKQLTKEDLDRATIDHPVCLVHVSVHEAVVNSKALIELGISRDTQDPAGGKILIGPDGNPNGILSESAFMGPLFFESPSIYAKVAAGYDKEQKEEMMVRCAARFHQLGIVGAHDPFVDSATLQTYQSVAETGRFPFRLYAYVLNKWADPLMAAGIKRGFGSECVKIGAIKLFLDGGMSSRTAAVMEPYAVEGGGTGILNYDQEALNQEIEKFNNAGYQISVHAQGDRALGMLLKAFERVMKKGNPLRHHIVHAGNLTEQQIEKVRELELNIVSQANFFSLLGDGFIEAYGPVRSQYLYRFNTLLKKGIRLAFSSDCPVADPNPLIGLRDAVLRKSPSGKDIGRSESIEVQQALSLYTREAAYISFEESERGTITEGKMADFVVLDKDPLTVSPEKIPDCRVEKTIVGGKIVYNSS